MGYDEPFVEIQGEETENSAQYVSFELGHVTVCFIPDPVQGENTFLHCLLKEPTECTRWSGSVSALLTDTVTFDAPRKIRPAKIIEYMTQGNDKGFCRAPKTITTEMCAVWDAQFIVIFAI